MLFIEFILLFHAFATWMMIGVIFFVQVVYLPLYLRFKNRFSKYEKKDLQHMGYLIGPLYFLEILSAIFLAFVLNADLTYRVLAYMNLFLIMLIWVVSSALSWRAHKKAEALFLHRMHHIMLTSNWFRTICWGIRGCIVLLMLLTQLHK